MGRAKQLMIEIEQNGYVLPDSGERFLCSNHYDDIYLNQFIIDHSMKGKCSYCAKKTEVLDLHEFTEYVIGHIKKYYGNPDDENLPLANSYLDGDEDDNNYIKRLGAFIVPPETVVYESTADLLYDINLNSDNQELDSDIKSCFCWDTWVQHDPMILSLSDELSWKWKEFEVMVKHKQRFTFMGLQEFKEDLFSYENGLSDILTEISKLIANLNLIKSLQSGSEIYRSRFTSEDPATLGFEGLTSAPNNIAKQSRMSPAGISMFYGSFNFETAVKESKPTNIKNEKPVIGEFKTACSLDILDLTKLPVQSFWSPYNWQAVSFLHSFSNQVSKQIERDDRIHIEYIPTQVFTEYLRFIFPNVFGQKIDGIVFKSSLNDSSGNNIVLFYDQKSSKNVLNLIQTTNL